MYRTAGTTAYYTMYNVLYNMIQRVIQVVFFIWIKMKRSRRIHIVWLDNWQKFSYSRCVPQVLRCIGLVRPIGTSTSDVAAHHSSTRPWIHRSTCFKRLTLIIQRARHTWPSEIEFSPRGFETGIVFQLVWSTTHFSLTELPAWKPDFPASPDQ